MIYIYIYIYIERERERERGISIEKYKGIIATLERIVPKMLKPCFLRVFY